ncbi:hypothetical protein [Modestobacter sp. SSW1-42]|uniref:hypothetical protein n=1 Tax=Modestobacter sp. SSW1-42 TaxID=596372 RepID=UPI00398699A8
METERSNIRQATNAVQDELHTLGNHLSFMQQSLTDPEPPNVDEDLTYALKFLNDSLAALEKLRQAQSAYDNEVDFELL